MKKADLYEIVIKILGLYLIVTLLNQIRELALYSTLFLQSQSQIGQFGQNGQMSMFLVALLGTLIVAIFVFVLIFRTKQVTKVISRPSDYAEDLKLFAEKKTIYEISLVIIGLVTLVLTVPDFIFRLKGYVQLVQNDFPKPKNEIAFLIIDGIKLAIGILALVYSKSLASLLANERKTTNLKP
ncbi:hypothetical protein [Albibacterium profundi]|uniref:Uncharacterized protein n=1 Tax=Albibacterium profundi TaxID=3134906 RepID=A0ABV5CA92_9SPHI